MAVTHKRTVVIVDRSGRKNTLATVPGTDKPAFGQELILGSNQQRGLDVQTNTFCLSGQFQADGTLMTIGGDSKADNYVGDGQFSIRAFPPCDDQSCGFSIVGQLQHNRWYPSTQILPDGRIIIVGGSITGVQMNSDGANVPYIEYFPRKDGEDAAHVQFLQDTLPYNLYPFVHLLPSGLVFIFAKDSYILWNTEKNEQEQGNRPTLERKDDRGNNIYHNYPLAGSSALMPLSSTNGYTAEVLICGGTATGAYSDQGHDEQYPASNKCFRISPEAQSPQWEEETMASPRVMPYLVLLPDGHVLVIGGTQKGYSGFENSHSPALVPELYNAYDHQWYRGEMVASKVPRTYHACASLLHDGSVLVTGSNPHEGTAIRITGEEFPTEFRSEIFHPPYFRRDSPRPILTTAPNEVHIGEEFEVAFKYATDGRVFVTLAHPGFSTHSFNHGMRNVLLDVVSQKRNGNEFTVRVRGPPNKNVAPPTWYWLFVLVDGLPNEDGHVVFVK